MLAGSMRGLFTSGVLVDGNAIDLSLIGAPMPASIWAAPTGGDTVNIWLSPDDGVTWIQWTPGAVTAATFVTLPSGMTRIRGQRTLGSGVSSTFGVC